MSPGGDGRDKPLFSLKELSEPYKLITLKTSLTIDALPKIQRFHSERGALLGGVEVLSETGNRVATLGQAKDGRRTWFNMAAFDEFKLNVIRKYFFIVDEQTSRLAIRTRPGMRFDYQAVLGKDVLEGSYPSENARRIAILKDISDNLRKDIEVLGSDANSPSQDNKTLSVCGMLINQTLELILVKLKSSPVLATKLGSIEGIDFDHINFGRGKVRMAIVDDMVAFAMRFGAFVNEEESPQ